MPKRLVRSLEIWPDGGHLGIRGPMTPGPIEPEVAAYRQVASELASQHKDAVTSAYWLAALASRPTPLSELLAKRQLTPERILQAARGMDEPPEALEHVVARARQVARRMGGQPLGGVHLLISILSQASSAGRRTLEQLGADPAKLRTASMTLGLGLVRRRPAPELPALVSVTRAKAAAPQSASATRSAVAIPIVPSLPRPRAVATKARGPSAEPGEALPLALASKPTGGESRGSRRRIPLRRDRFVLDKAAFPQLTALGQNLTLLALDGKLSPALGRQEEVEQLLDVLAKRQGNNPCLVGPAGVGKTTVVHALAAHLASSSGEDGVDSRLLVEIPLHDLLAGTAVRGALAARLQALRKEVQSSPLPIVLFFDDVHRLFSGEASDEAAAELKQALGSGELCCIGATSLEDYRRFVEPDRSTARRFSMIEVTEPAREDTFLMLSAHTEALGSHHKVTYSDEAVALSIAWSIRYMPGRALPDKALSLLDLSGARTRRRSGGVVDREAVAEVVAELCEVPLERLLETDHQRMLELERAIAERVVGHREEVQKICRILRRNAVGLGAKRPIGTFLLLGPTGVGKTETAKAVAQVLFDTESAMTRIDMSEYSESHSVARLIGAPPGYVGFEAGGQLTEAVRRRPYQVVLLDEIEKAHPEVLTTFLGVFDEGRLTDGRGRTVDFTNVVLMLTSNLGAREASSQSQRKLGFGAAQGGSRDLEAHIVKAARQALLPELYNRIDEVLVFKPLSSGCIADIANRLLERLALELQARHGVKLVWDATVVERLLALGGYDPEFGARPLKRTLARLVEAPLAEELLGERIARGDTLLLLADTDGISLETLEPTAAE